MFGLRISQRLCAVTLAVISLSALSVRAQSASPANDELLNMMPADVLFCVRINNFDYSAGRLDEFLSGASPMPLGISMLARMQLARLFGSPELSGINTAGNFAIFGVLKPDSKVPKVCALIPVADYKQFVEGNTNVSQPDANGLSKITISAALTAPGAGPLKPAEAKTAGFVTSAGRFALISKSSAGLSAMAGLLGQQGGAKLAGVLSTGQAKQATAQRLWAYANVQLASKTYGQKLLDELDKAKEKIKSIESKRQQSANNPQSGKEPSAEPAVGQSMEMAANVMDAYADILRMLMNGAKSVTISSSPKPEVLSITATINTVPGTELAALFGSEGAAAPADNKLPGYLEDGAAANGTMRMDTVFWRKLINDKAMGFVSAMFAGRQGNENISKMMKTAAEMSSLVSNAVFSVSAAPQQKPPFEARYVYTLKDPERYVRLLKESLELYNTGMGKFYDEMGMQTEFKLADAADNYKGVPIGSMSFDMKMTDTNSPQAQTLTAMYGGGFNYKYAVVDKNLFTIVGPDPNTTIRRLIDTAKAGGPAKVCSEITQAMALIPDADKADFLWTLNVLRMAKIVTAFVPIPLPALPDVPTASNLVFAGRATDGSFTLDIAVPKQHLMEITSAVQMIMQQKGHRPSSSTPPAALPGRGQADKGLPAGSNGNLSLSSGPLDGRRRNGPAVRLVHRQNRPVLVR